MHPWQHLTMYFGKLFVQLQNSVYKSIAKQNSKHDYNTLYVVFMVD